MAASHFWNKMQLVARGDTHPVFLLLTSGLTRCFPSPQLSKGHFFHPLTSCFLLKAGSPVSHLLETLPIGLFMFNS